MNRYLLNLLCCVMMLIGTTAYAGDAAKPTVVPAKPPLTAEQVKGGKVWPEAGITFEETGDKQGVMLYKGKRMKAPPLPNRPEFQRDENTVTLEELKAIRFEQAQLRAQVEGLTELVNFNIEQGELAIEEVVRLQQGVEEMLREQGTTRGQVTELAREAKEARKQLDELLSREATLKAEQERLAGKKK